MQVRKLRLQRGWSQEVLAEMCDVSTRTIQRIERGQAPSQETQKALASVFEIPLEQITQEPDMNSEHKQITQQQEEQAIAQVREIKAFYSHLSSYLVTMPILLGVNLFATPEYLWVTWVFIGWTIGLAANAISAFELFNLFGADWERRQVEKRLGRKL